MTCLVCFLISSRTTCLGVALPPVNWVPLHQSLIKNMSHRLATGQSDGRIFSVDVLFFPKNSNLYQIDKNKQTKQNQAGHPLVIPSLGKQRQVDLYEFEVVLVYRVSSRTARVTQSNPVLKKPKQNRL